MAHGQFERHEVSADYAAALWHRFILLEWRKDITLPMLDRFERFSKSARALHPEEGHGLLVIIPPIAATPQPEVRNAMAGALNRATDRTLSVAAVYEATGLQATVLRSIAAAINLMARQKAPTKIFATLREATQWQGAYHKLPDAGRELFDAAERLRTLGA